MEIEIDHALVSDIVAREYECARKEITQLGVMEAYRRSTQRHDERIANAGDAHTLACKASCFWCCYFSVDVRPVEVFVILDYLENKLSSNERERIKHEINVNAALLEDLSDVDRAQRNIKCPFLADGRCTIYEVRPQTCRNYHATSAIGCQLSFEHPDNLDIDPEFAPLVYQSGGAHVDAFSKAMQDEGYDVDAYELNSTLHAALANPALHRSRFEMKQKVFAELESTHVPFEFLDDRTS